MSHLHLNPGPITSLVVKRGRAHTIEHDDAYDALVIDKKQVDLSKQEYALVLALLQQREQWEQSQRAGRLCMGIRELQQRVDSSSAESVRRQLDSAKLKLAPYGINIVYLPGQYLILFDEEMDQESDLRQNPI